MQPLDRTLRRQLESTIKDARDIAETAARAALDQLGVGDARVPAYLSPDQRDLRVRLRAHGRQLGDLRNAATGAQERDRLVEEVAYEHWHRMLFARFLAENHLLMYPDPVAPVPVSLDDCAELAADEGAANAWELASRYATGMLPQIFRPTSPVFALDLPPERQQALERLLEGLAPAVFTASDGLGWVYQFWQAKRKQEVNDSEVKIGARELPAVTQLFTEPYMVSFLLDNALGAWWVGKISGQGVDGGNGPELRPGAKRILEAAESEDQLRAFFALPGVPMEYLRFVRDEDGPWWPAAGWFEGWPESLAELTMLDPCCGSGHFLVAVLIMLVPMRMELERLTAREAVDAALRQNIHGLEIDQRCVEIAAFALALAAWTYPDAGGYRALPNLHLACSGLSVSVSKREWLEFAVKAADRMVEAQSSAPQPDIGKEPLWHTQVKAGMEALYDLFEDAPVLGSLAEPKKIKGDMYQINYSETIEVLRGLQEAETKTFEETELGVVAQGMIEAANLLSRNYTWIATNVPFKKASETVAAIQEYISQNYPEGDTALETAFVLRILDLLQHQGSVSLVLPQNWMFLTSYESFRMRLLRDTDIHFICRLGSGAFEMISGEVVKAVLFCASNSNMFTDTLFASLDTSNLSSVQSKASCLTLEVPRLITQKGQLNNPDSRIILEDISDLPLLREYGNSYVGLQNGDTPKYVAHFWEIDRIGDIWSPFQMPCSETADFAGRDSVLRWNGGRGELSSFDGAHVQGIEAWNKAGVAVRLTKPCPCTIFRGDMYDQSSAAIIPDHENRLAAIWLFCQSPKFRVELEKIDQKRNITNRTFVKVPFDLDHWTQVAVEQYPHGLPEPYSDDPTQWIFHGHPCGSVIWDEETKWTAHGPRRTDETVLQVAVARLLGYRWPAELDAEMELAAEQRAWVERSAALLPLADKDGIVCIPPVHGELSAADRLTNLLAAAYGDTWNTGVMDRLLTAVDWQGKSLDRWLRDKFFAQHCKLFQHRPFIWHIWDGQRDGFAALVNYHKLDHKLLETLIYTYLGDWMRRQQQEVAQGIDGAQERFDAAKVLQQRLLLILQGESPYDIFIRWKPLEEQPIGWHPDLNDGVRLNIRPFMTVPDVGKKGAGVLRDKPTSIKWGKDRGKDVPTAPWFHLGPFVGGKEGDRINDYHLSLAEKQSARRGTV